MRARHRQRSQRGETAITRFTARIKPFSVIGLLATIVLLFGFQGQVICEQPMLIALIAVPLLIQSYAIFVLTYVVV
jgi:ACR3 family arsenite transporter